MNIWYGSGENIRLSNLYHREFVLINRKYYSVEHAYQTWKSGGFDGEVFEKYTKNNTGRKITGRRLVNKEISSKLMYKLLKESFDQNSEEKEFLKSTAGIILTHNQDRGFWKTEFPRLLMKLRDEYLRSE